LTRKNFRLILALVLLVVIVKNCSRDENAPSRREARDERVLRDLDEQLKPEGAAEPREGLAAAIAIDVSGSMAEKVTGRDGSKQAKIQIARSAALDLVDQFASYARDHKDEPVQLAIYEFSARATLIGVKCTAGRCRTRPKAVSYSASRGSSPIAQDESAAIRNT